MRYEARDESVLPHEGIHVWGFGVAQLTLSPEQQRPRWKSEIVARIAFASAQEMTTSIGRRCCFGNWHVTLSAFLHAFERHVHVHDCWKPRPECSMHVWRFMCGDSCDQRIRGKEDQRTRGA
jgi:hypothetical protein